MTVTSVPCQVVRSTTQVYFNIRIDQKRRRAIHFCEQCRYYGRYCDAIHKGRNTKCTYIKIYFFIICLYESDKKRKNDKKNMFLNPYRLLPTGFDTIGTYIDITENSQIPYQFCFRKTLSSRTNTATYSTTNSTKIYQSRGYMAA